jgi:4-amino-4-deoxy-L-arabinose transferase-like glycosyltransferase
MMYSSQRVVVERRVDYGLLALILVITAVKGVLWSIAVPLWQGPDENRHFATVQFIAERGHLPGTDDIYRDDENVIVGELSDTARLWYAPEQRQAFSVGLDGPREDEILALDRALRTGTDRQALNIANHLAPLYYVLGALPYRLAYDGPLIARLFAVRLLSVVYAVGTVFCAFLVARQVFPERRDLWFTVPVLVTFQPMFTFATAIVNSDALLILLYSVLLYLAVRIAVDGLSWQVAVAAGVVLGLGMLTKPLVLGALPVLALAVVWDTWTMRRERQAWRTMRALMLMGISTLAVCGWWLWRSMQISGSLLYANPTQTGAMPVEHPYYDYTLPRYAWHYVQSLVGGVFVTYWADFGWIDTPLAPGIYWLLLAVCALAMVGLIIYLVRIWRQPARRQQAAALSVLLTSVPVLIALIGYNTYRTWVADGIGWGGMQGRYYLGCVVAAMAGLALGLVSLVPSRWRPAMHVALRWGVILLNVASLYGAVLPRYYL